MGTLFEGVVASTLFDKVGLLEQFLRVQMVKHFRKGWVVGSLFEGPDAMML